MPVLFVHDEGFSSCRGRRELDVGTLEAVSPLLLNVQLVHGKSTYSVETSAGITIGLHLQSRVHPVGDFRAQHRLVEHDIR